MPKSKYQAAIIGCGNIGTRGVLTHAQAYAQEPRTSLVAVLDQNKKRVEVAAKSWGVRAYHALEEMFNKEKIDIVSVCVPDEAHEEILNRCLKYVPKVVFCEKPLTTNLISAKKIVEHYAKEGVMLAVNFSRRWNPGIRQLKANIEQGKFGRLMGVHGIYTKGILHNGSHMIDLIRYLAGEIKHVRALNARIDWKASDPAVSAYLQLTNGAFGFIAAGDERYFSIFDLELVLTKARISLKNFGEDLVIEKVKVDPLFKGYKILGSTEYLKMDLKKNIHYALGNLIDALEGKDVVLIPAKEAYFTQQICHQILKGLNK